MINNDQLDDPIVADGSDYFRGMVSRVKASRLESVDAAYLENLDVTLEGTARTRPGAVRHGDPLPGRVHALGWYEVPGKAALIAASGGDLYERDSLGGTDATFGTYSGSEPQLVQLVDKLYVADGSAVHVWDGDADYSVVTQAPQPARLLVAHIFRLFAAGIPGRTRCVIRIRQPRRWNVADAPRSLAGGRWERRPDCRADSVAGVCVACFLPGECLGGQRRPDRRSGRLVHRAGAGGGGSARGPGGRADGAGCVFPGERERGVYRRAQYRAKRRGGAGLAQRTGGRRAAADHPAGRRPGGGLATAGAGRVFDRRGRAGQGAGLQPAGAGVVGNLDRLAPDRMAEGLFRGRGAVALSATMPGAYGRSATTASPIPTTGPGWWRNC
jgi:hypothetical protein